MLGPRVRVGCVHQDLVCGYARIEPRDLRADLVQHAGTDDDHVRGKEDDQVRPVVDDQRGERDRVEHAL